MDSIKAIAVFNIRHSHRTLAFKHAFPYSSDFKREQLFSCRVFVFIETNVVCFDYVLFLLLIHFFWPEIGWISSVTLEHMCCFGIQLNSIASIELFVHAMSNYQLSYFLEFSLSNVLYGGDRLLYSTVLSILSPLRRVHRGNLTRNGKHFFALQLKRQHHALTVILLCIVQCNIGYTHTFTVCTWLW